MDFESLFKILYNSKFVYTGDGDGTSLMAATRGINRGLPLLFVGGGYGVCWR